MNISKKAIIFIYCLIIIMAGNALPSAAPLSPYIDDDFILFWPDPVRAYPDIPLNFHFTVYEIDNESLTWQLTGEPAEMTIYQNGSISWTPTTADTGTHTITVRVTRESGDYIERTFTLTVGTDDFIFVSTHGVDTPGNGTLDQPFATIDYALRSTSSGDGKTVYVREGTYKEHYTWEVDGVHTPFYNKDFTAADPLEIRSYPGEWAILDCEEQGHGLWVDDATHVIVSNLEIKNASVYERGGLVVTGTENVVIKDTIVHDSHWVYNQNCTGYKIQNAISVVLDHTIGYDNGDLVTNPTHHNSSNYLIYTENSPEGDIYILNSKSFRSICGYKIKHSGDKRLILHNNQSLNDVYPFAMASGYSSIRYCVSWGGPVRIGVTDVNNTYQGSVLIEHNTIVNAATTGIEFSNGDYGIDNSIIRNNIIYNDLGAAGTGENDNRLMSFWIYDSSATTHTLTSDYNLFYSPGESNIIRLGNSDYNYSLTRWQSERGLDTNGGFGDPLFADAASGDFSIPESSPANYGSGNYAGAYKPGLTYDPIDESLFASDVTAPATPGGLRIVTP